MNNLLISTGLSFHSYHDDEGVRPYGFSRSWAELGLTYDSYTQLTLADKRNIALEQARSVYEDYAQFAADCGIQIIWMEDHA